MNKTTINHTPERADEDSTRPKTTPKPSKEHSDEGLNGVTVNKKGNGDGSYKLNQRVPTSKTEEELHEESCNEAQASAEAEDDVESEYNCPPTDVGYTQNNDRQSANMCK